MWDVHVRLGGTKGTNINAADCPTGSTDMSKCASAFLGLHITSSGSGYFENVWVWNADIWAGLKQTETPYFQPTPNPPAPFTVNPKYGDPPGSGKDGWGLVISTSSNIFFMGLAYTASSRHIARHACPLGIVKTILKHQHAQLPQCQHRELKQVDNINGFAGTISLWEAPSTVPQGQCDVSAVSKRRVMPSTPVLSRNFSYDLEVIRRQSEDYNHYGMIPN
ncbi:hypothetical protein B0H13DRAFT_2324770 [Mycena leptocephala]|nr:hypothetical protein B0H13DRAFT_2324770 [Mycena leptocephala]